jgi:glycosyltransferase involved in cell wall biosynthesis
MSSSPEVSVVIPTHNRADLLPRAVESVLDQDVDLELIVVDDCSTDGTAAALERFGPRVRVLRSEHNIERGAARNWGAREARAPILAFLDSDDEWKPGKLSRQIPLARQGFPSVTGVDFVDPAGEVVGVHAGPPKDAWNQVRFHNWLLGGASSLVLPAELFHRLGGYPEQWSLQGSEDWLLLVKLWAAGSRMEVIREPLVRYLVHRANYTADPERFAVSMWGAADHMARRGYVTQAELPRLRGHTATVIARGFAAARRWEEAAGWARIAVREGTWRQRAGALTLVPASACRALLKRSR